MANTSISNKLAELKLANKQFTLAAFLTIYNKAGHECYINYMEGAALLLDYMTSNSTIPLDYQLAKYPRILDQSFKIPRPLGGYEFNELAALLTPGGNQGDVAKTKRALYLTSVVICNV